MSERKYDIILWDADNTLLNFDLSQDFAIRESFRRYGIEIDRDIVKAYSAINDSYWKRLERREIEKLTVLRGRFETLFRQLSPGGVLAHKKLPADVLAQIDVDVFRRLYQQYLGSVYYYQDDSFKLVKKLKEQGFKQYIITNGVAATQRNKLTLAGFYEVMDDVYISEEIGANKPDVDFFEGCFDRMRAGGTEPARDRMLVVGDSPTSDMQGARNAGIDCCQYLGISQMEDGQATYRIQNLWELEDIICQNHPIRS